MDKINALKSIWDGFDFTYLLNILLSVIPALVCITLHELSHGFVAYKLGDDTAKNAGRLTLNPIKHLDIMGLIMMVVFHFGWAKPVPVNFGALRNPKRDMIWVALAGPGCNLLQAVIWGIILKLLVIAGVQEQFFLQMAVYGISINIFLMAFNLIPIPPLDGGRVAVGILPWSVGKYLDRIEPYGMWIVLALCLVGGAGFFTGPLVAFGRAVVNFFIGL